MDKIITKSVLRNAGINVVPWVGFARHEWKENPSRIIDAIVREIDFPCFVKPSNMGSSVGITKVKSLDGDSSAGRNANLSLKDAIDLACEFDSKILVEKGIDNREIECAVLGNNDPKASELGEIKVGGEFYDFHDKYVDGKSSTEIPVSGLDPAKRIEIQEAALAAYKELSLSGLSRVDFLMDKHNGTVYLNEINTMPGFTSISMYPKMWAASGVSYPELLDKLVTLGFERFAEKSKNKIKFDSGSEWYK
jgi:D-alanine-D-alanine ligase